jgi:hypothetical protein
VPMSQQWTISMQRVLPGKWMVEAAYTANKANNLAASGFDYNQTGPGIQLARAGAAGPGAEPIRRHRDGIPGSATISRSQSLKPYPYYTAVRHACRT